jgi:hypothetical protein
MCDGVDAGETCRECLKAEVEQLKAKLEDAEDARLRAQTLVNRYIDDIEALKRVIGLFGTTESGIEKILAGFKEIEKLKAKLERVTEAIDRIKAWCNAYPVSVFAEPDFTAVRMALEDKGLSLDAVSASNMRHVVDGIRDIVEAALAEDEGE